MKTKMFRQGDVLIKEVSQTSGTLTDKGKKILAYGEVTGHTHELIGKGVEFFDDEGRVFVSVPDTASLVHQEHAELEIPQGQYKVIIQREFDIVEGTRQVSD